MSDESKQIPIEAVVYVVRFRKGEPVTTATVHFDAANKITFTGDAGEALEPLLRATQKATAKLAWQTVDETRAELRALKERTETNEL